MTEQNQPTHPETHFKAEGLAGPGRETEQFEIVARKPGDTAWRTVGTLDRNGPFTSVEDAMAWWQTHAPADIVSEAHEARIMRVSRTVAVASIEPAFGWDRFHHQERLVAQDQRVSAARTLWANVPARDFPATEVPPWEFLADPANRALAAETYRKALDATMHRGISDVRYAIHDAARVLGLGEDDLRNPTTSLTEG